MQARTTEAALERKINFAAGNNISALAATGMSFQEQAGIWTVGTHSGLILEGFPEPIATARFAIFVYPNIIPGRRDFQRLTIGLNDEQVWSGILSEACDITADIPLRLLSGGRALAIAFEHPDAIVPATAGHSDDIRDLAIMLCNMSIRVEALAAIPDVVHPTDATEVWRGLDDWLFLTGGSNEALRYFIDPDFFPNSLAAGWAELLVERQTRLAGLGVRYLHIGAPDKITVYPDMFNAPLPFFGCHPLARLSAGLQSAGLTKLLVDPIDAFRNHPRRHLLYMKTDTHWSYYAGVVVLQLVLDRLGQGRQAAVPGRDVRRYTHPGDLGGKVSPTVEGDFFAVETRLGVTRIFANELAVLFERNVALGLPVTHNSICTVFRNDNADAIDETLIIFGDSFMDFQPSNTTLLFAECFREVHFIWSANIDFDYVREAKATLVISETAERFMRIIPNDNYSLREKIAALTAGEPA